MRFQDTPNYGDEAGIIKQAQEYYIAEKELTLTTEKIDLSEAIGKDEFYLFNAAFNNKARVEKTDLLVFNSLKRIKKMNPTSCSPICTLNGNILKVAPMPPTIEIAYFRKAKTPKLTFRIINMRDEIDDSAGDFQDLDIHPIMLHAVFIELLLFMGINLKDEFSVQLANNLQQEELLKQGQ
ncbi:hypothetical protein [uncultured Chryseobacterium sp.]|uniref:hypothetical protein n=1 Tax=uncultured Chryseobacterium sp. TaxID=259322 RepID=UPI0025F0C602|nr:hypothetical protein [uncultured Chryseobacterium sp.]